LKKNGVVSVMVMSNGRGTIMLAALERVRLPLNTVVTSLPTLFAKVVLRASGAAVVDESVITTPGNVVAPNDELDVPSPRKRISRMLPVPISDPR